MFSKFRLSRVSLVVGVLLLVVGAPALIAVPGGSGTGDSHLSVRNSAETSTPTRPTSLEFVPTSPSNNLKPLLKGNAGTGDTVRVWKNGSCSGASYVDYPATLFAQGVQKRARENQTTAFSAVSILGGTPSPCSDPVFYVHDEIAPAVTLAAPANGAATSDPTPTFNGTGGRTLRDAATVTIAVYAGPSATGSPQEVVVATIDPTTGNYAVDASPALPDGTYTALASQGDDAGNTGQSTPQTFDIVTGHPAPTIDISGPSEGAVFTQGDRSTAAYACTDPGGPGIASCAGSVANGAPIDTSEIGPHSFSVTAVDSAGFEATKTTHYTVLRPGYPAPSVEVASPSDGAVFVQGAPVNAAYTCTDRGGPGIAACTGPVPNGASIDTDDIGPHAFSVTATDRVGSEVTRTSIYRVLSPGKITLTGPVRTFHRNGRLWVDTGYVAACPEKGPDCVGIITAHRTGPASAPLSKRRFGHTLLRVGGGKAQKLIYRLARTRTALLERRGNVKLTFDARLRRGTNRLATAHRTAVLRP
jgi:hypothetical protein